jgi:hypothetical protein
VIVDINVGISDNRRMATVTSGARAAARPAFDPPPSPATGADGAVFDLFGMPLTTNAARSMNAAGIRAAMGKALANLHPGDSSVAESGASGAALDSLEVIWLLAKFDKPFGRQMIDLTKVPRTRWSTLDDVAILVRESIEGAS